MSKTIVYIAGPMRGIERFNFPAFDAAQAELESRGYVAISPAAMDREHGFNPMALPADTDWSVIPNGFSIDDAIRRDYEAILSSHEVCLLPGWQNSKGATAEKATAEWRRMRVWEYKPEDVLDEAARITRGDRQASYGPPDQDFRRTADMWNGMWQDKLKEPLRARDVAMAMVCLKLSRLQHSPKRDSVVDIAGYARCLSLCDGSN